MHSLLALSLIRALLAGDGLVVTWVPPPDAVEVCVGRVDGDLLGCQDAPGEWRQGSVDVAARVVAGEVLEVRAWDAAGELIAVGRATVRQVTYLPSIAKPPR